MHHIVLEGIVARVFELFVIGSLVLTVLALIVGGVYLWLWFIFDVLVTRILKYSGLWIPFVRFIWAYARLKARKQRNN